MNLLSSTKIDSDNGSS